jgi:hypothetical protein
VTVLIGCNTLNRNVQFATEVCTASIARTALFLWGKNRKDHFRNFSNACSNPALVNQFMSLINVGCVEVFLQNFRTGCQSIHVIRLVWNSKINYHIRHNPTFSFINLIQTITFSFASTLLISSNVWLVILSVPPLYASQTEFWMLFLSLPFGATWPAHLIFNDKPSDLAVQEGLDSVDLRWGYRKSHWLPSKSSSICYTSPCSTILHMQRLLVIIFGSGMRFWLVIWITVRWRIQTQAERKNAIESSS